MNNRVLEIARMIDHSVLHPTAGMDELEKNCALAREFHVASICVKPYAVAAVKKLLSGSDVVTGTVIGFPHGNSAVEVKTFEAEKAISDGAAEIDMVVNIAKVLEKDWTYVESEIKAVLAVARKNKVIHKVIFENDLLPEDEFKIRLCEICSKLGVDYVKTSTGFGYVKDAEGHLITRGATAHDVELMRKHSSPSVLVKASGGVRNLDDLLLMKGKGAARIGTSSSRLIMEEAIKRWGPAECR
jgi:deoxyribose-phosphate aldolase